MSKENNSVNGILEELSPDSHNFHGKDTNNSNSTPIDTQAVEVPKSLEQLELERLEAISQGELSDTTINYSSYANKPNKVIENPTQSTETDPYTKGVVRISSRPEFKERVESSRIEVSSDRDGSTTTEPIKIDSRNAKAKSESTSSRRKDYSRSHNEISDEDFSSMAEKLQRAKAKRQLQIDELNSKYHAQAPTEVDTKDKDTQSTPVVTPTEDSIPESTPTKDKKKFTINFPKKKPKEVPTAVEGTPPQEVSVDEPIEPIEPTSDSTPSTTEPTITVKKAKKSILQRIVDYYTYAVDENGEAIPPEDEEIIETITESEPLDVEPIEETTPNSDELTKPKQKESFKEFITTLFTTKDKPATAKKETFKERMVEFFSVQEDGAESLDTKEDTTPKAEPIVDTTSKVEPVVDTTSKVEPVVNTTPKVESMVDTTSKVEPMVDTTPKAEPVVDTTSKVEPVVDTTPKVEPIADTTPKVEPVADTTPKVEPVVNTTPKIEPVVNATPKVEPVVNTTSKAEPIVDTTPKVEPVADTTPKVEPVVNTTPKIEPVVNATPKVEPVVNTTSKAEPIVDTTPKVEPVADTTPKVEPIADTTSPVQTVEESTRDVPTPEEVAHVEEIVNGILADTSETDSVPQKKPNVFRRIKNYFLMDEAKELSVDKDEEDYEEEETILEDTTPTTDVPTPTTSPIETTDVPTESQTVETETVDTKSKDDYIVPFSEDTPEEDIDIPIDEGEKYSHFWQDPDFNPIDRFKSYVENTSERYRSRKRSGEIHIEIKSNPDTAILFSDLESIVLAEEELLKSREEFKKQVENGEYDNYDENSKGVDNQTEPTFQSTSINDFNAYEDKPRVQEQISEMKTGTFVRSTIIGVLCVLSTYIALANDLGLPTISALNVDTSATGYLMVQSVCGLVAILTCIKSVASGIVKIFKGKADSDSISSVGIVSAFISSLVTFLMASHVTDTKMLNIYMPVALLGVLFNLVGKSYIVKREQLNFRYISKDKPKYGMFCIQDDYDAEKITKGLVDDYPVTAYTRKTNFTSDFVKYTYSYDMADRFSKYAVPIICVVSLVVSLISALVYNQSFDMVFPIGFFSILSMLLSFCSCFSIPVYINSMLYHVSRKYAKRGGAVLGYQAVEDFYDTNSLIVNAKDIFPKGSISISALKLFSNAKVDETLIYAISLANHVDSILAPTLLEILDGNLDMLCKVENCSYEDGLGICGWIDNKRVLMGNRQLMETHNIENLPTKSKEMELVGSRSECVYVSVSGNLSLMLILDITPNHRVAQDLQSVERHGIALAICSCDFLVSINKLSYLFGIDGERIKIIPSEVFEETKEYFTDKPKCSTSIVTNGDIGMMVNLLLATKKVHAKAIVGNILSAVSCIVGIIIGISFISMGGFRELTSTMVLVYNLICTGVTMLICNSKRF